jgi:hypothetical protein
VSLKGRWRIVEVEAWDKDFLDLVEPAYILFGETGSEFAFGCVTGSFGFVGYALVLGGSGFLTLPRFCTTFKISTSRRDSATKDSATNKAVKVFASGFFVRNG